MSWLCFASPFNDFSSSHSDRAYQVTVLGSAVTALLDDMFVTLSSAQNLLSLGQDGNMQHSHYEKVHMEEIIRYTCLINFFLDRSYARSTLPHLIVIQ